MKKANFSILLALALVFLCAQTSHAGLLGDPNAYINGNLGIGIASPTSKVHVYSTTTGYTEAIKLQGSVDPLNGSTRIVLTNPKATLYLNAYGSTAPGLLGNAVAIAGTGSRFVLGSGPGSPIAFFTNNNYLNMNAQLYIGSNGNVGIGTSTPAVKLDVVGEAQVKVLNITGGSDLSEQFNVNSINKAKIEPGMVVCIDAQNPGKLVVSSKAYDRTVAGIISGAGDVKSGMIMGQARSIANGDHPVALTGRVFVMADATKHAIAPGDLLTTSNTPGHAMKATDPSKLQGAALGKAMTGMDKGKKGLVLVLVSLQ